MATAIRQLVAKTVRKVYFRGAFSVMFSLLPTSLNVKARIFPYFIFQNYTDIKPPFVNETGNRTGKIILLIILSYSPIKYHINWFLVKFYIYIRENAGNIISGFKKTNVRRFSGCQSGF